MTPVPFRFGSDEQFANLRNLFVRAQFTDAALAGLGITDSDSTTTWHPVSSTSSLFAALFQLFLQAQDVSAEHLRSLFTAEEYSILLDLGLLVLQGEMCRPTVRVRPCRDIYVLSDTWKNSGNGPAALVDDVVMMPDSADSRRYVNFLPSSPCERLLEACGGAGTAALLAAKSSTHVWSVDISERATQFARFSARLNGITNCTMLTGNAYDPVPELQFDRIVAHPPFVPTTKHTWLFHDGGEDGESVLRRHVEGLARVLAPGGEFHCRCIAAERTDSTIEQRIRTWLGEAQTQFDVAVFDLAPTDPVQTVVRGEARRNLSTSEIEALNQRFRELRIKNFQLAYVAIQHHSRPSASFSVRRRRTRSNGPDHVNWLLRAEAARIAGSPEAILNGRLRAASVRLDQSMVLVNGDWDLQAQRMHVEDPFPLTWEVDAFTSYLLPLLDGKRTGDEVFRALLEEGIIPSGADASAFATVVGQLVSGGFILLEGHEPPPPLQFREAVD